MDQRGVELEVIKNIL